MDGSANPVRASTPRNAAAAEPHHPRVDPRYDPRLDPRYEYPFPEDPAIPCCAPSRVAIQPPAAFNKGRCTPAVVGVVADDYEDRDPNRINQHLQVQVLWEDVVAEPDGVRSPDMWWRASSRLFRLTRDLVYAVLACALGPFVACALGASFAVIAFTYIWCVSPVLRASKVCLGSAHSLLRSLAHTVLAPVTEALGFFLSNIRVRIQSAPTAPLGPGPELPPGPLLA